MPDENIKTYYASPERASKSELKAEIKIISTNSVINGLMTIISGLLAVLNKHRQIIALNDTFLEMLDIKDSKTIFGLRPGEAIQCIHATKCDGGCGTSEFCCTCSAAIAIVTSLAKDKPVDRMCAVTVDRKGKKIDLYFQVHCYPITFQDRQFLLLFLQDRTKWQQMASLEKVFFHDINNIISGLINASELMLMKKRNDYPELARIINQFSLKLHQEVKIQKYLLQENRIKYQPVLQKTAVKQIVKEIQDIFIIHPVSRKKSLKVAVKIPEIELITDISLLLKVLTNMLINAFEATKKGGEVKLSVEQSGDKIIFSVWNKEKIPYDISLRIFQRNFTTKKENGRGIGTYSMKIFGEKFLGGEVDFNTSKKEGTTFYLRIPL
jgi:hypothetical protein